MQKLELIVKWWSSDDYYVNNVTLLLDDEKIETIKKAQTFILANPDIDYISIGIDDDCTGTLSSLYKITAGKVVVRASGELYFKASDKEYRKWKLKTKLFKLT